MILQLRSQTVHSNALTLTVTLFNLRKKKREEKRKGEKYIGRRDSKCASGPKYVRMRAVANSPRYNDLYRQAPREGTSFPTTPAACTVTSKSTSVNLLGHAIALLCASVTGAGDGANIAVVDGVLELDTPIGGAVVKGALRVGGEIVAGPENVNVLGSLRKTRADVESHAELIQVQQLNCRSIL